MAMNGNNNLGKNIGKGISNLASKAKNRADNGKDYDVMNPGDDNPNLKAAKKQGAKVAGKAIKAVGKAIAKLGRALIEFLIGLRTSRLDSFNNNSNFANYSSSYNIF